MSKSYCKKLRLLSVSVVIIIGIGCFYFLRFLNRDMNITTFAAYKSQSDVLSNGVDWLSFDMQWEQYHKGDSLWSMTHHVVLHYGYDDMVFVDDPFHYTYFKITKSSADIIDYGENKIISYKKRLGGSYTSMGLQQELGYYIQFLWYYLLPSNRRFANQSKFCLTSYEDLSKGNGTVRKYKGYGSIGRTKNNITGEWNATTQDVFSYVNNNTNVLDSVRIDYYVGDEKHSQRIIRISNLRYDNRQRYIDSIFNLDNPRYAKFSHHDEKNPEDPWSDNKSITEELANYPLVNLEGDTTTIAENEGWLLLNFWSLNCAPCIQHLKDYQHEKDSLGYRILENEGIRILAINQKSDNMELIAGIAQRTDTWDIMYSGKGIGGTIELPYLGYFYLISPDKEVVYDSSNLGDYSELLKAKTDYEKQN